MARTKQAVVAVSESAPVSENPHPPELVLTPEEMQAIVEARSRAAVGEGQTGKLAIGELANALVQAIEATRPPTKKTPFNRVKRNPYYPKDGSPRSRFKRPMYHHGLELNPEHLYNEWIDNLNKLKPGIYCGGHIRVTKRRDGGLDIDYPIRTAAQRLKLVNQFGITDFGKLVARLVDERNDPAKYRSLDDDD
jgi:hypothetical protein